MVRSSRSRAVQRTDVRPQSTVSINVPSVSAAEWHPFTVAAVRGTEGAILAELHIKPRGKWAQVRQPCAADSLGQPNGHAQLMHVHSPGK